MAITVSIIRNDEIAEIRNENGGHGNSLKALLYYLRDNAEDDYVRRVATYHANSIQRQEERKQREIAEIIANIEDMILENMDNGDSATILSIQRFADEQQREITHDYVSGKNRKATRPKIEKALKNLVEQGYLQESIERVEGYSNYVKVWTKIQ